MNMKNCSYIGLSSPNRVLKIAFISGVIRGEITIEAGSPGMILNKMKMSTAMMKKVTMISRILLAMYLWTDIVCHLRLFCQFAYKGFYPSPVTCRSTSTFSMNWIIFINSLSVIPLVRFSIFLLANWNCSTLSDLWTSK